MVLQKTATSAFQRLVRRARSVPTTTTRVVELGLRFTLTGFVARLPKNKVLK